MIAESMPEKSILCGDSGGGAAVLGPAQTTKAHTWLNLTGGSIGQGGPAAIGAAIAEPDRQVFALLGDGASMYTNQALWTQARERLNLVMPGEIAYVVLDPAEAGEDAVRTKFVAAEAITTNPWYANLWQSAVIAGLGEAPLGEKLPASMPVEKD